ncbi:MAG: allantoate amidohydrolase [Acidimicrobiales bacterium]
MADAASGVEQALEGAFAALAPIGARADGGFDRFAWTKEDRQLRGWFEAQAAARDLTVDVDGNGNQWAWWGTPAPGSVVTGSHLDSVPGGGACDGPLGVLSGVLALDELRRHGTRPARPVAVTNFVDEEGARFGVACAGSRLLCGTLAPAAARALRDADGVSLADAMTSFGADPTTLGADDARVARIGTFVELHVEQGRALAGMGAPVGVATAIWPHGRWRLRFSGEGNHAGTTRLDDRRDPLLPFAATVLAARDAARRAGAHATVGRVEVHPNGVNVIASRVDAWLDARAPDPATVDAVVAEVVEVAHREGDAHGVAVEVDEQSRAPEVAFGDALRARLAHTLGGAPCLPTGAGHDAGVMAGRVPSAMLFVRNPTGISHSPAEHAEMADCAAGVRALAAVVGDLAGCR